MKNYISVGKAITAFLIVSFAAFACTSTVAEEQASENTLQSELVQVGNQKDNQTLEGELPKDYVCMVNNAYMGKKQIPVAYENKIYYGCCEMCVDKIKNNQTVRYATDLHTGKKVDKASAFIALNPKSNDGSVLYFESAESYNAYKTGSH